MQRLMFSILVVTLTSLQSLANMNSELIEITESITVDAPIQAVYEFAADTTNDHYWRSEVHEIQSNGPFMEGTVYLEDAHLGIHRHYFTKTFLLKKISNKLAIYETTKDNGYFLRSSRFVEKLENGKTKFTYKVEFEHDMMKEILGVPWPPAIGKAGYRALMKIYLRNLNNKLSS